MSEIVNRLDSKVKSGIEYLPLESQFIHNALNCDIFNYEFPKFSISRILVDHLHEIISLKGLVD